MCVCVRVCGVFKKHYYYYYHYHYHYHYHYYYYYYYYYYTPLVLAQQTVPPAKYQDFHHSMNSVFLQ